MPKNNLPLPPEEDESLAENEDTIPGLMEDEDENWMESLENLRDAELEDPDESEFQ